MIQAMNPSLGARALAVYSAALIVLLVLSGWQPHDGPTWAMEVAPVAIVLVLLWATHRRFPLSPLLYGLIFVHAVVLMLGGHYTYARVPLGDWLRDAFGLARNPYDGIGHFAQGFIPALAARELLLRHTGLQRGAWLAVVVVNGAPRSRWARVPMNSSAPRATPGTRRRTWPWPVSAR
jgi:putative membrane protein